MERFFILQKQRRVQPSSPCNELMIVTWMVRCECNDFRTATDHNQFQWPDSTELFMFYQSRKLLIWNPLLRPTSPRPIRPNLEQFLLSVSLQLNNKNRWQYTEHKTSPYSIEADVKFVRCLVWQPFRSPPWEWLSNSLDTMEDTLLSYYPHRLPVTMALHFQTCSDFNVSQSRLDWK